MILPAGAKGPQRLGRPSAANAQTAKDPATVFAKDPATVFATASAKCVYAVTQVRTDAA